MWTAQSEKILKQKTKKERVNFLISKEYRDRYKGLVLNTQLDLW